MPTGRCFHDRPTGKSFQQAIPGGSVTESTPMLLFFTQETSGPARRMESLLAHLARKERGRLRISRIDAPAAPEWVDRLDVTVIPTLILLQHRRPVERLEGRVSAPQIERMLAPYLEPLETAPAVA
ncbi:MAG TPA: thioredoxin family protein [Gaiellaceae bacterium]|nr:thioredoxin family protein [Gaiellaceae bacterium]